MTIDFISLYLTPMEMTKNLQYGNITIQSHNLLVQFKAICHKGPCFYLHILHETKPHFIFANEFF